MWWRSGWNGTQTISRSASTRKGSKSLWLAERPSRIRFSYHGTQTAIDRLFEHGVDDARRRHHQHHVPIPKAASGKVTGPPQNRDVQDVHRIARLPQVHDGARRESTR